MRKRVDYIWNECGDVARLEAVIKASEGRHVYKVYNMDLCTLRKNKWLNDSVSILIFIEQCTFLL